jgi:hypothetical protein
MARRYIESKSNSPYSSLMGRNVARLLGDRVVRDAQHSSLFKVVGRAIGAQRQPGLLCSLGVRELTSSIGLGTTSSHLHRSTGTRTPGGLGSRSEAAQQQEATAGELAPRVASWLRHWVQEPVAPAEVAPSSPFTLGCSSLPWTACESFVPMPRLAGS